MNRIVVTLVLFVALVCTTVASAQFEYDFFWSDKNLNEGATNGDLVVNAEVGEVVELYMYWSTNGPADSDISVGCAVDVSTTQSGVVAFESAETLEFEIVVPSADVVIGARWQDADGAGGYGGGGYAGPTDAVSSDFIDLLWAFTVSGNGILEANNGNGVFLDTGYDSGADAFLWGKMTFSALAPGEVQIVTVTDESLCVNGSEAFEVAHSLVTVNVGQSILVGDVNLDGEVNLLDVQPFVDALIAMEYLPQADINFDGLLDLQDVAPFVAILSGG